MSEKVFFTTFKTSGAENLLAKLHRLMKTAGFETIDFTEKYAAIKIHFGEYGNLAFLRPNYAKVVADYVKQLGGKPFLTDCNTLYVGSRKNALDHLDTAYVNGFSPLQTGCHVIIGDGLKGTDETLVPIDLEYVKEAKIGQAVMDADVFISLTHFKGHEMAGFGGAIKNIGMGCGSRAGKMEMHCEGKPSVDLSKCIGCGACDRICAHQGPEISNGKAVINHDKCVGCGRCLAVCPKDAIAAGFSGSIKALNCKMAEYAMAVCKDRPCFHISLICDVSPNCDCHAENDIPIIPNVGMLASFDPVALDQACADLCNQMPITSGSILADQMKAQQENTECCHLDVSQTDSECCHYDASQTDSECCHHDASQTDSECCHHDASQTDSACCHHDASQTDSECCHYDAFATGDACASSARGVHAHTSAGTDHFKMTHPDTEWQSCLEHAQKIGLGSREYELVRI